MKIDTMQATTEQTDLDKIEQRPSAFAWGKIVNIHKIDRYAIVEAVDRKTKEVSFHVYVDGRDTHTSATTMARALLCALSYGALGLRSASHMAIACAKLLDLP